MRKPKFEKSQYNVTGCLVDEVPSPDFVRWRCELLFEEFEKLKAQIQTLVLKKGVVCSDTLTNSFIDFIF